MGLSRFHSSFFYCKRCTSKNIQTQTFGPWVVRESPVGNCCSTMRIFACLNPCSLQEIALNALQQLLLMTTTYMSEKGFSYFVEFMDVVRGALTSWILKFVIFLFIFLVEKCFFLVNFEVVKWNFPRVAPLWKNRSDGYGRADKWNAKCVEMHWLFAEGGIAGINSSTVWTFDHQIRKQCSN